MHSRKMKDNQLPQYLHRFFWEYDPDALETDRHADLIMDRIMERGSWRAMQWLCTAYSGAMIARFLSKKGWRLLPPREVNYWALVSGMPEEEKKRVVQKAIQPDAVWSQRCVR